MPWSRHPDPALHLYWGMAPLFVVTIHFWSSALLILGASMCSIALLRLPARSSDHPPHSFAAKMVVLALFSPMLAIAISALLRGDSRWEDYDSASRFLIAIVVFVYAMRTRIDIARYVQFSAPTALLITLLHQWFVPQPWLWGSNRMATYFADPLVFGYVSLTLGLLSLVSIHLRGRDCQWLAVFKLLGASTGLYLSIMSGSATGWMALLPVLALWLHQSKNSQKKFLAVATLWCLAAALLVLFFLSPTVDERLGQAVNEVLTYSWNGIAPDTSVGLRITFLRIAKDMFVLHPWAGYGDTAHIVATIPAQVRGYASEFGIHTAMTAGFHNELISNAIRYGLPGVFSSMALFAVPLWIFFLHRNSTYAAQRANATLGMVFTICIFVSSLSTEVFDLKNTASFYATVIALFCASTLTLSEGGSTDAQNLPPTHVAS